MPSQQTNQLWSMAMANTAPAEWGGLNILEANSIVRAFGDALYKVGGNIITHHPREEHFRALGWLDEPAAYERAFWSTLNRTEF